MGEVLAKFSWGNWFRGFLAAAIGGAVSGGTQALTDSHSGGGHTAIAAGTGALLFVGGYLLQSPLLKPKE